MIVKDGKWEKGKGKRERKPRFFWSFSICCMIFGDDAGNPKDWFDEFSLSHRMWRARCLEATVVKLSSAILLQFWKLYLTIPTACSG